MTTKSQDGDGWSPLRRPFHAAVAALGGGVALAEASHGLVVLVAVAVAAVVAGSPRPARYGLPYALRLAAGAAALLLVGAALGHLRLAALDRVGERIRDGEHVELEAHLLTLPRPGAFGASAEVEVVRGRLRGARLLARAARWSPLPPGLEIGAELALSGTLRTLRPGAGGSRDPPFNYATYLRQRGVAAELMLERAGATGGRRGGASGLLDRVRARAQRAVVAGLPADRAALLRGMVLGEDERIDAATRDDWRDSGLAHLLAVSGQNVMLLAALALPLLGLARARLRTRLLVLTGLIALYVPLAGAGPSLQRAGIMGLAGIAAMAASRPASRWYGLILAATATLLWNPRAWSDPGWQLSFAAVAGILTIGVPLQGVLRRAVAELTPERSDPADPARTGPAHRVRPAVLNALADGLAVTVAATLATGPLLAHHFGYVPLAGLPANLLALPAVAPAMWLGLLKAALGQLPAAIPAAAALGAVASLPLGYLGGLAEHFADLPGARLRIPLASQAALFGSYGALAVLALGARRAAARLDDRLPEWGFATRALPPQRRRAVVAAALAAAALAATAVLAGPAPPDRLTVRFLDVGQGDATLVQHPDGTAVLFDGGPPEGGVVRLLRRAGVDRLALVVATHPSRDHHGGLAAVLRRFPVDALLDGGDGTRDPSFRALERLADSHGVERIPAVAPLSLAAGDLRIDVLSPPPRPPGPPPEDPNPRAVVAIVGSRGFDLLLSADAESEALLPLDLPDVDAMKVPHHGSSDPDMPEVLARVRPEVAGIEVGLHNTYGHPAPQILRALRAARVPTYRTDRDGTVTLTVDRGLTIRTER